VSTINYIYQVQSQCQCSISVFVINYVSEHQLPHIVDASDTTPTTRVN